MPIASPLIAWLVAYRYLIVYPLAILEGPVVMMISGFLVRTGFFSFWPVYLLLMAGDLTGDIAWYFVGRHGARPLIRRYGHFISLTEENVEKMEKLFHKHEMKILLISKITMGFGFALATLIAAGAAKIPFKRYFFINFFGQFVWTGILMAVGFFFGQLYTLVDKSLRWGFVVALILLVFAAIYGFGKAMRKRFM
jgi:membrane protein DedA with SNARE-associated domain